MPVELSAVEQRHHAAMEAAAGGRPLNSGLRIRTCAPPRSAPTAQTAAHRLVVDRDTGRCPPVAGGAAAVRRARLPS